MKDAELIQAGYRYALSLTHDPDAAEDLVQAQLLGANAAIGRDR